jgi:lipoate-protein ligase A
VGDKKGDIGKRHCEKERTMKWRVIDTGIAAAATNMAIDEAIMLAHAAGDAPPTLRFYGWEPAAVSIGYFQQAEKDIDIDACAAAGVSVVRRLTGGRAVLHDMELTYSIVVKDAEPAIPSAVIASYGHFSTGLLAGLRLLGINAEMSLSRHAYGRNRGNQVSSAACFDTPSNYEVTYDGRKLVGSAQVRKHGVILQHGSVLLRFSAQKATAVLKLSSSETRTALEKKLETRVIAVEEILQRSVTYEEVAAAVATALGPALGIELQKQGLMEGEKETASRLVSEKYSRDSWNLMR